MRLVQLDILRALAVLLVMAAHFGVGKERNEGLHKVVVHVNISPCDWEHLPQCAGRSLMRAGWIGVDLFFVLSGFLVSSLLFREHKASGEIRLKRFLIRRGFKIYPGFYALLSITLIVFFVTKARAVTFKQVLCESLFLTNYGPNIWGHTWTLAIEEHFYLLLGLLLLGLSQRRGENPFACYPKLFLVIAITVFILRLATSFAVPQFDYKTHAFPTHLRLDSLMFGSLLAYYHVFAPRRLDIARKFRLSLLSISLALISVAFIWPQDNFWIRTVGLTGLYLGFGGALLVALTVPLPKNRWLAMPGYALASIGIYSYSIYLWHLPIVAVGVGLATKATGGRLNAWGEACIYIIGSIAFGVIMAKIVEFPMLRIRDRLFPKPTDHKFSKRDLQTEEANAPDPALTYPSKKTMIEELSKP